MLKYCNSWCWNTVILDAECFVMYQVFGKLITPDGVSGKMKFVDGAGLDSLDGDHDLKEHMVGILFSRSKLSHLQRQVSAV